MSYRLSNDADHDLLTILVDGIERFGEARALAYRDGIEAVLALLGDFPEMARLRTDFTPPLRVHRHSSHVIVYTIEEDGTLLILRIRHGRENWLSEPL